MQQELLSNKFVPITNVAKVPYYLSEGTAWTVNDSGLKGPVNNLFVTQERPFKNLGYQGFNQSTLVTNPTALGGLWFGGRKARKARKSRKSCKSRKSAKKSRKSAKKSRKTRKNAMGTVRTMGPRMITPGSVTTQDGWGFNVLV